MSNQKTSRVAGPDLANPEDLSRSTISGRDAEVRPRLPIAVLLDDIRSMYNVGAFFRAADGVGLQKLCLCGITAHPPKSAISKTALGAEETVPWEHSWDAVEMLNGLRSEGYEIAAIETSPHAIDLYEWQPKFPVCVAFGNEVQGLRKELLEFVVLYELLRKYRILSGNAG